MLENDYMSECDINEGDLIIEDFNGVEVLCQIVEIDASGDEERYYIEYLDNNHGGDWLVLEEIVNSREAYLDKYGTNKGKA